MRSPISLEVDFIADAGYLAYATLSEGQFVTRTQRVHDAVHVDFDAESQILGIELLGFDDAAIGAAQKFVQQHDLAFPKLLARATV